MTHSDPDRESWLHALPDEITRFWKSAMAGQGAAPESLGSELAALGWALLDLDPDADAAAARERLRAALAALRTRLQTATPAIEQLRQSVAAVTGNVSAWPQLGPWQAQQGDLARLEQAGTRYATALADWSERLLGVGEASIVEFERRLEEDGSRPAASALMDLWCDIAEARYEAELDRPEHAEAYAELVNAGAALRLAWLAVLDPALEAAGLPSRRTVEDLHARMDRLAREQRQAVAELRQRLDGLTGGGAK